MSGSDAVGMREQTPPLHVDELVGAYALDALEPRERVAVEEHLAGCRDCAALEEQAREVAMLLPLTVSTAGPPPELRGRLLARIAAERRDRREEDRVIPLRPVAVPASRPHYVRLVQRFAPAALAAAALLVLGLWNLQLHGQVEAQRDQLALLSRAEVRVLEGASGWEYAEGRQYQGRAYIDRANDRVMLAVSRLPALQSDQVYQLWFIRPDGGRDSGGTFRVNADESNTFVAVAPAGLDAYREIGITVEPTGGSAAPTSPRVVGASL